MERIYLSKIMQKRLKHWKKFSALGLGKRQM